MKNYPISISTLMILAIGLSSQLIMAQTVDKARMHRDIEVASQILESLHKEDVSSAGGLVVWGLPGMKFTGNYLEGYGVVFQNNGHWGGRTYFALTDEYRARAYNYAQQERAENEEAPKEDHHEEWSETKDLFNRFLTDYAYLISQLQPSDRITLRVNGPTPGAVIVGQHFSGFGGGGSFSASVKKSDVDALQSKQITKEEFLNRVEYETGGESVEKEPELDLLGSLFHRLYKGAPANRGFHLSRKPSYERLQGYGVIYHLKFNQALLPLLSLSKDDKLQKLEDEEAQGNINEQYEDFKKEMRQNLIDYGRILTSLQESEKLVVKALLPKCKSCDLPESVTFTVKQSTLAAYRNNQISLNEALNQVSIDQ